MMKKFSEPDLHLQFVKKTTKAEVIQPVDDVVSTSPHLLVREVVAAEIVIIILTLLSLFIDAPLEEIANPSHTPNPAKAPWYFLGMQELLHYFPPVVAGVLIPGLIVVALVVIPYVGINIHQQSINRFKHRQFTIIVTSSTFALNLVMFVFHCWAVIAVTFIIWIGMITGIYSRGYFGRSFGKWTLPNWIMLWFVSCATLLTIIGVFFRGPGWSWVWPWIDGIY